uniref:Uncharacterized protein n=1 Tax=Fagus sylvatica TaxID=28930 RepID=A0A2N9G0L2_FAGSY
MASFGCSWRREREREFALVCGGARQESSGSANGGVLGVELRSGRENQELQTVASVWVFGSLWLM